MQEPLSNSDLERIRAELAAGRKIEAIKIYRFATGAGLAEAKQAVEAFALGNKSGRGGVDATSNEDIDAIQAALFAGEKIKAIKLYRAATGEQLKDSKDFIDALEDELRRTDPTRFTAPRAKGCGVSVLAMLLFVGCFAGFLWWIRLAK